MARGVWGNPLDTRGVYQLTPESFELKTLHEVGGDGKSVHAYRNMVVDDRVGSDWAKGRLKVGDLLLCGNLSGDCFYNWYLLSYQQYGGEKKIRLRRVSEAFGGYAMGQKIKLLNDRQYKTLLAFNEISLEMKLLK